jgi:arginase
MDKRTTQIDIIGVPMDYGAGRRGVDMGPSAIRYAGLLARLERLGARVRDTGDLSVPLQETASVGEPTLRHLYPVIQVLQQLHKRVAASVAAGRVPLVLGGDHSLALGTISGAARERRVGVVWIDAHTDFNSSETTPSGNIHGMPLAALCGIGDARLVGLNGLKDATACVRPENIAIVAARDIDEGEKVLLREAGAHVFTIACVDRYGMHEVMRRAIEIASADTDGIYLSFDLDAVDEAHAPGVGTPVPGGLSIREAHLAMEMIAETGKMLGIDVVEVNPILDDRNRTAELAVDLTLSAFGKTVFGEAACPEAPAAELPA